MLDSGCSWKVKPMRLADRFDVSREGVRGVLKVSELSHRDGKIVCVLGEDQELTLDSKGRHIQTYSGDREGQVAINEVCGQCEIYTFVL